MKKIVFGLLLCMASLAEAQVVKTNMGYLVTTKDLSKLDFWARKGVECQNSIDQGLLLIEQIRLAKISSDSATIEMQRISKSLKDDLRMIESELLKTKHEKELVQADLMLSKEKNKKLKRDNIIVVLTAAAALTGSILLFK